jgi:hypothetical protein
MADRLSYASKAFRCEPRGASAVLRIGEAGFDILTGLGVRADFFALLSEIEASPEVAGMVVVNDQAFGGDEAYRRFMARISDAAGESIESRRLHLSLKEDWAS